MNPSLSGDLYQYIASFMRVFSRLKTQHWVPQQTPALRRIHARSVLAPLVCPELLTSAQRSALIRYSTGYRGRPVAASHAVMAQPSPPTGDVFFLDGFALRQWDDSDYSGTHIAWDKADFVKRCSARGPFSHAGRFAVGFSHAGMHLLHC